MVTMIRNAIGLLDADRRGRWVMLIALAAVVSIVEAAGALLVFGLMGLLTSAGQAVDSPPLRVLRRVFPAVEQRGFLLITCSAVAVFFLCRGALILAQSYAQNRIAWNTGTRLSERLLRGTLELPYAVHLQRNSADMMRTTLDSVTQVVSQVFVPVVLLASEALIVLAFCAVLVATAPVATIASVGVLVPIVLVLLRLAHPALAKVGTANQEAVARSYQSLQESLHGVREVKLFGREAYFVDKYRRAHGRFAQTQTSRAVLIDAPRVAVETLLILFVVGFLAVMLLRGGSAAQNVSLLGLFAYAALRLMPSLHRIVTNINNVRFGSAAVDVIREQLALMDRHREGDDGDGPPLPFTRVLELDGVCFRYEGADVDQLSGVTLTIERGEHIGIVGPTGGGKTTLLDIVIGLLEPVSGAVRVDGVDIRTCRRRWQRSIGIVPQNVFLLDDTLGRNVAFGVPDEEVDADAIAEALRLAQLTTFVASLRGGVDARIGERGIRLSGGQRQRLAIARALYRKPAVLVFDEGTSALDNRTEEELVSALEALRGERTILMVAHRLSSVERCDRIALIDGGRLRDVGSFEELRSRSPAFQELAR